MLKAAINRTFSFAINTLNCNKLLFIFDFNELENMRNSFKKR